MGLLDKFNLQSFFGMSDDEYDDYEASEEQYTMKREVAEQQPVRTMQAVAENTTRQQQRQATRTNYSQSRVYGSPRTSSAVLSNSHPKVERPVQEEQPVKRDNLVSMQKGTADQARARLQNQGSKIAIKEPRLYQEALEIGKLVLSNEAVLINFHLMEESAARRVIDFLTGVVYAVDGDVQRVGNEIFI
ncbi:MAG: cell division protein SepF, partial [Streptococcaceae bacterium]|nr:cell division protein SepF [Streptococcaceae bacterium]